MSQLESRWVLLAFGFAVCYSLVGSNAEGQETLPLFALILAPLCWTERKSLFTYTFAGSLVLGLTFLVAGGAPVPRISLFMPLLAGAFAGLAVGLSWVYSAIARWRGGAFVPSALLARAPLMVVVLLGVILALTGHTLSAIRGSQGIHIRESIAAKDLLLPPVSNIGGWEFIAITLWSSYVLLSAKRKMTRSSGRKRDSFGFGAALIISGLVFAFAALELDRRPFVWFGGVYQKPSYAAMRRNLENPKGLSKLSGTHPLLDDMILEYKEILRQSAETRNLLTGMGLALILGGILIPRYADGKLEDFGPSA